MSRASTIQRSVLSDQVKDRLLQAILDGRYPPGSRIVETRAAREFGTSQAPVREALRDLEALGVVEISPFRGARVQRPTAEQLLESHVVRSELESLGARLALPRITDEDLELLAQSVDEMRRAAAGGDSHTEAAADAAFHLRLLRIGRNSTLERVWQRLEPFSRTYITLVVPGADRLAIAELHVPILEALRARNEDDAVAAVSRHFASAGAMLGRLWDQETGAPVPDAGRQPSPEPGRLTSRRAGQHPAAATTAVLDRSAGRP